MQKEISFFRAHLQGVDEEFFFLIDSDNSLKLELIHQGTVMKVSMSGKKYSDIIVIFFLFIKLLNTF